MDSYNGPEVAAAIQGVGVTTTRGPKRRKGFTGLWAGVPDSHHSAWSTHRELTELLCGALFHLEWASKLGPLPSGSLEKLRDRSGGLDWKDWVEERQHGKKPPVDEQHLRQAMYLADAAFRLEGVRALLADTGRVADRGALCDQLGDDGRCKSTIPRKHEQLIIVATFRDMYAHGEVPPKSPRKGTNTNRLMAYRQKCLPQKNLAQVMTACREVWEHLADEVFSAKQW